MWLYHSRFEPLLLRLPDLIYQPCCWNLSPRLGHFINKLWPAIYTFTNQCSSFEVLILRWLRFTHSHQAKITLSYGVVAVMDCDQKQALCALMLVTGELVTTWDLGITSRAWLSLKAAAWSLHESWEYRRHVIAGSPSMLDCMETLLDDPQSRAKAHAPAVLRYSCGPAHYLVG